MTDFLAGALCAAGGAFVLADIRSTARPGIVLVGLVLGTGWAITGWITLPFDIAYVASIVLAVGISTPIIVSGAMVETGYWHPVGAVAAILCAAAAINVLLLLRDIVRRERR